MAASQIRTRESGGTRSPAQVQILYHFLVPAAKETAPRANVRRRRKGTTIPLHLRYLRADWRLPTASMMPSGSPVPFTSFTKSVDVEDVLWLQVPAPDLAAFIVWPLNTDGRRPFVCIYGQNCALRFSLIVNL